MPAEAPIWLVERSLWTGGRLAYATHMATDGLVAVPPNGLMDLATVLGNVASVQRWSSVAISHQHLNDAGLTMTLGYHVVAQRGRTTCRALCTSVYRRDAGMPKLIQHHQCPLA